MYRIYDLDVYKRQVLNKKETAIAQSKQEMIKQEFQDWIWSVSYTHLLTRGELTQHLAEVEQRASKMEETILSQMAQKEGVTEQMKACLLYTSQEHLCL